MAVDTKGITHWLDILIIVLYFLIVLGVGLWTVFRPKKANVQGYFLAGRSMPWFAVGASLFSSNIGSEHFVGLAGAGSAAGIALILFEWFPIILILMLGWLFLPVYISAGVFTLPEYLEKRHGGHRIRTYMSCLALVIYVITKLASAMYSGALFIQMALKWNMYLSLGVLLFVTAIYTVLGGLTAVMYTDTFQTAVMLIGSAVVMVIGFVRIGGYQNLETLYMAAIPSVRSNTSSCGLPRSDAFHVFLDPVTGDQPWPGLILQASLGCLWYWCCDQVIVQRSLAAKSLSHAKGGSLMAGLLKITPLFLIIFPGMISRILFPDEVACTDPEVCQAVCDNPVGCSNIAYPKLVLELLPTGARGLLLAVMLSAIMSSLTSIFNSASTVFTLDLWTRIRPSATQRELLVVGRMFVVVMCVVAILWVPMVKAFQSGRLFNYMIAVESYVGSPLGVLFLLSIFWKRTTEQGAFYGIILGHICGISRLVVELIFPAPPCGEPDERIAFLSKFHNLYFAQLQQLFTAMVIVLISLCTTARSDEELRGVTWWTKHNALENNEDRNVDSSKREAIEMVDRAQEPTVKPTNGASRQMSVDEDTSSTTSYTVRGRCSHWCASLCGLSHVVEPPVDASLDLDRIRHFLTQKPTASLLLNGGAVALLVGVAFITGFYR